VVEDDYDSEFRYVKRPLAAAQGLDGHGRVIYVGTFSRVVFPSLRIGYLTAPPALVDAFLAARTFADTQPATLAQATLTDFMDAGHFERHIRRMRNLYRERQEVLVDAARAELAGRLDVQPAEAGMHLIGWLPEGRDDLDASRRAAREGIDAIRLSFFALRRVRRGGVRRLAKALA